MKKTNIRVRRNGGSKPASPQAPNKPDATPMRRYEGVVQLMDDKLEVGMIGLTPEIAAELNIGSERRLMFLKSELPQGRELNLRAGARVTFSVDAKREGRWAVNLSAITLAADLPADGWQQITHEFYKDTIDLHEVKAGRLARDKLGRLFIVRKAGAATRRLRPIEFREVSFTQACDWLVNQEFEGIPETFLVRHGISAQAQETDTISRMRDLDLDNAVDSAFALIELMEHPLVRLEEQHRPNDRADAFTNGLVNMTSRVQNELLALKANYRAALKGAPDNSGN